MQTTTERGASLFARIRLPRHVGLIPDGNRRWARARGLHEREGYRQGVKRGLEMLDDCIGLGIDEVSVYGFTVDNTKRPRDQTAAFAEACAVFAEAALSREIDLRVIGDTGSPLFPESLKPLAETRTGGGRLKVNMLVNYGWNWDIQSAMDRERSPGESVPARLASSDVSRIDLVVRWGGMRRLSGFLPVQTVYADFFVVDDLWPDYEFGQFGEALVWYAKQDQTLGG